MDQPEPPTPSVGASLLGMLAFLALTNVGMMVVTHWVMPQREGWGMFGGWLLNLVVIFGSFALCNRGNQGWLLLSIPFAVFALMYGIVGGHIPRAIRVRESPVLPVADADRPEQRFDVWHFSDGKIEMKYAGSERVRARSMSIYYHVAPVVPADWKPSDKVPAWVVSSEGNGPYPESWDHDYRGGYDAGLDSRFREIVQNTARRRSLQTSETAPLLIWSEDPKKAFMSVAWIELGFLLAIDLVGIVMVLWPAAKS
jgi:hypothetical protein